MKTGHLGYHLPFPVTISHKMKKVFVQVWQHIAKMLKVSHKSYLQLVVLTNQPQEYDSALNFTTDAWTLPNHKAYVAITVYFEHEGTLISMILNLVGVAMSHSGVNLAETFAKVLEDFGIKDKVRFHSYRQNFVRTYFIVSDPQHYLQ